MEKFLSNLLNRHRGQIASVKPRPVYRFEDNLPGGHATAESQSPNSPGWVSAKLSPEEDSRQSSLTSGYQDEREAVGIAPRARSRISPRTSAPNNLSPSGSQSVGVDKGLASGTETDTHSFNTASASANGSSVFRTNTPKESGPSSAGMDPSAWPDTPPVTLSQRSAQISSGDSRQADERKPRFAKPSVAPEKTLMGSNRPAKAQPIPTTEGQVMALLKQKAAVLRELNPLAHHRAESAGRYAPPTQASALPELPPALHITIGRIEVRATSPPQATTGRDRPPQSGPLLSLTDYLNRRSGKNR